MKDQGLPEKNVALLIRKEQQIMSNNDDGHVRPDRPTHIPDCDGVMGLLKWHQKHLPPADGAVDSSLSLQTSCEVQEICLLLC